MTKLFFLFPIILDQRVLVLLVSMVAPARMKVKDLYARVLHVTAVHNVK